MITSIWRIQHGWMSHYPSTILHCLVDSWSSSWQNTGECSYLDSLEWLLQHLENHRRHHHHLHHNRSYCLKWNCTDRCFYHCFIVSCLQSHFHCCHCHCHCHGCGLLEIVLFLNLLFIRCSLSSLELKKLFLHNQHLQSPWDIWCDIKTTRTNSLFIYLYLHMFLTTLHPILQDSTSLLVFSQAWSFINISCSFIQIYQLLLKCKFRTIEDLISTHFLISILQFLCSLLFYNLVCQYNYYKLSVTKLSHLLLITIFRFLW